MAFEPIENLRNHTVVVTGAGGGIGRAICQRMAKSQARVIGIARSAVDELQSYLDSLPNGPHIAYHADVTVTSDLEKVASRLDKCDILVTSAGHSRPVPHRDLDAVTDEFFEEILISNLRSVFSTIRTFRPLLAESPNALIVNIGSASTLRPGHGSNVAYVSAKAGVEALTKNLALALSPEIRVVSVCPSSVNTGFLSHGPDFYQRMAQGTPLGRIATPDDIASAVEALATRMRFMTGNTIAVDGGRTL